VELPNGPTAYDEFVNVWVVVVVAVGVTYP
jgi:hypothetical protein